MTDAFVIFCTCQDQSQAQHIAEALVDSRLAACVNIISPLQSIYRWQGSIERAEEALLLIKTTHDRLPAVRDRISELHTYETPEIIALPIVSGSEKYLSWLREQV